MRVRLELRLKPVLAADQVEVVIAKRNIEKKNLIWESNRKEKKEPSSSDLKNFFTFVRSDDVRQQQQQDRNHRGGDYFHFPLLAL